MALFKRKKRNIALLIPRKRKAIVDVSDEADWIIKNCTDKYSKDTIMEILDYEMGYLASIGLTNISEQEFKSMVDFWKEHNE